MIWRTVHVVRGCGQESLTVGVVRCPVKSPSESPGFSGGPLPCVNKWYTDSDSIWKWLFYVVGLSTLVIRVKRLLLWLRVSLHWDGSFTIPDDFSPDTLRFLERRGYYWRSGGLRPSNSPTPGLPLRYVSVSRSQDDSDLVLSGIFWTKGVSTYYGEDI